MKKNIFMTLVILIFLGCSEKEAVPKTPVKEKIEIRVTNAEHSIPEDFIPEHLKHSKIEVVKHY
jgi:PBP1b-binding outer membrane lipoprotein LpoB